MTKKRLYESVQRPTKGGVAIYRRYSSQNQSSGTLEKQLANLKEAIARIYGWEIVADYCEPAKSAATETYEARPQWMRLLDDATKHLFDVVMVESPDRWSRNEKLFYDSMERLRNAGVYWLTADGKMTSESIREPGTDIVAAVQIVQAASYSRQTSKKITDGIRTRASHGLHMVIRPPFGFALSDPMLDTALNGTGRYERFLIPDENFEALAIMRDLHLSEAMGASLIAARLTSLGYRQTNLHIGKQRSGLVDVTALSQAGRPITPHTVAHAMHNELYAQFGTTEHGTIVTPDGHRYEGRHVYAWTREEFARIQEMTTSLYKAPRAQGTYRSTYPLAGLAVCAGCHLALMSFTQNGGKYRYRYHICGRPQERQYGCPMTRRLSRCEALETAFGEVLHRTTSEHWEEDLAGFLDGLAVEDEEETREQERQRLIRQRDHLSWQHQHDLIDDRMLLEKTRPIQDRLKQLEPAPQKTAEQIYAASEQLQSVADCYDAATLEEKRRMAHLLIHPMGLVWDIDHVQIVGIRPFPEFLPGFAVALMPEFDQHEEWLWRTDYPIPIYVPSRSEATA